MEAVETKKEEDIRSSKPPVKYKVSGFWLAVIGLLATAATTIVAVLISAQTASGDWGKLLLVAENNLALESASYELESKLGFGENHVETEAIISYDESALALEVSFEDSAHSVDFDWQLFGGNSYVRATGLDTIIDAIPYIDTSKLDLENRWFSISPQEMEGWLDNDEELNDTQEIAIEEFAAAIQELDLFSATVLTDTKQLDGNTLDCYQISVDVTQLPTLLDMISDLLSSAEGGTSTAQVLDPFYETLDGYTESGTEEWQFKIWADEEYIREILIGDLNADFIQLTLATTPVQLNLEAPAEAEPISNILSELLAGLIRL